jgi:O-antigen/teichoic acid export membrane protein
MGQDEASQNPAPTPASAEAPALAQRSRDLHATTFYLIPSIISNALPLISMPFLTRILTQADFGLVALVQVLGLFIFGIANLGLPLIYERNYFKYRTDPMRSSALFWGCLATILGLGLVLAGVAHLTREIIDQRFFGVTSPQYFVLLGTLSAIFRGANQIGFQYLRNAERAKPFALFATIEGVVSLATTLIVVVGFRQGIVGFVIAQSLASFVALLLVTGTVAQELRFHFDWTVLKEAIGISAPLTLRTFIGLLNSQQDKFTLGMMSALGEVGIYSIAQRIAQVVFLLMNSLDYVFIPKVYRAMFEAREAAKTDPDRETVLAAEAGRYLTPFFYGSSGFALGIALFSEEVIRILTTKSFYGAIDITAILCLYYSTLFFGKVNGRQLIFGQKTFFSSSLTLFSVLVSFAFYIPLIRLYGAVGAAWSTLLSGFIVSGLGQYAAQKCFKIRWQYDRLLLIFGIIATAVIVHVILLHLGVPYPIRLLVKLGVVGAYFGIGRKFGYLDRHLTESIRQILRIKSSSKSKIARS